MRLQPCGEATCERHRNDLPAGNWSAMPTGALPLAFAHTIRSNSKFGSTQHEAGKSWPGTHARLRRLRYGHL